MRLVALQGLKTLISFIILSIVMKGLGGFASEKITSSSVEFVFQQFSSHSHCFCCINNFLIIRDKAHLDKDICDLKGLQVSCGKHTVTFGSTTSVLMNID